ncbi:hypothetical protein QE152_g29834 [Popillia japonica]|uniref:Uncharacterized protein n=1 Tax=Popillia japonica TaxID=7064 RepID=A0AAW1JGE7_POPJA
MRRKSYAKAYIPSIYKSNYPQHKVARSDFLEKCAFDLIRPQIEYRATLQQQIEYRATLQQLPAEIRRRSRALLGISEEAPVPPPLGRQQNYVGRCYICISQKPQQIHKKILYQIAKRYACRDHMRDSCTACLTG